MSAICVRFGNGNSGVSTGDFLNRFIDVQPATELNPAASQPALHYLRCGIIIIMMGHHRRGFSPLAGGGGARTERGNHAGEAFSLPSFTEIGPHELLPCAFTPIATSSMRWQAMLPWCMLVSVFIPRRAAWSLDLCFLSPACFWPVAPWDGAAYFQYRNQFTPPLWVALNAAFFCRRLCVSALFSDVVAHQQRSRAW